MRPCLEKARCQDHHISTAGSSPILLLEIERSNIHIQYRKLPTLSSNSSSFPTPRSIRQLQQCIFVVIQEIEIVFYDLDVTLIKTRNKGSGFPTNRADWMWWDPSVPGRLKREWEEGKHLVVLSNQGGERPKVQEEWKAKLPLIAAKVSHSPYLYMFRSHQPHKLLKGADDRCPTSLSVS
jgi:hypothetical protein